MQAEVLAVQEAFGELSSFADNNSSDKVFNTLLSYELLSLADRISVAVTTANLTQLAQCLKDCNRLAARMQAVRRLSMSLHHLGDDFTAYAPAYGD